MESPRTSEIKSNIHESCSSAWTADNDPVPWHTQPGQHYQNQASFWRASKYFRPSVDTKRGIQCRSYNNSFLKVPSISRKRTGWKRLGHSSEAFLWWPIVWASPSVGLTKWMTLLSGDELALFCPHLLAILSYCVTVANHRPQSLQ